MRVNGNTHSGWWQDRNPTPPVLKSRTLCADFSRGSGRDGLKYDPWICRNSLLNAKSQGLFFKKDAILTLKKPTVFPTFFGGLAENSWLSYTKTNSPPPVAIKKGEETGINVLIWEPSVSLLWFIPLLVLTLPIPITHHSSTEECHNYILETQTGPPSNSFSKPSIFNWITVVFI